MEAKELRIGNLIYVDSKLRYVFGTIYKTIQHNYHLQNSTYSENYENECEPIPLTEEWLLKLGFEEISFTEDRNRDWYKMFEIDNTSEIISLNYYTKTNYCRFNFDIGYGNKYLDLYYVHQLQNLYFALTGEELAIKKATE